MSEQLKESIRAFTTQHLLQQYYQKQQEYSPEALAIMKAEIDSRDISDQDMAPFTQTTADELQVPAATESAEPFVALQNGFSRTDALLAHAMLQEAQIPFYIKTTQPSSVLPLQSVSALYHVVHVPQNRLDETTELLEQHFHPQQGMYLPSFESTTDRLRGFNFIDTQLSELQMAQKVAVQFSAPESKILSAWAGRLLDEADAIEEQRGQPLFYYDNLEALQSHLKKSTASLTMMDLMTIIELMQIFCDEEDFGAHLEEAAAGLLDFVQNFRG
jgi:hypothetical protein